MYILSNSTMEEGFYFWKKVYSLLSLVGFPLCWIVAALKTVPRRLVTQMQNVKFGMELKAAIATLDIQEMVSQFVK